MDATRPPPATKHLLDEGNGRPMRPPGTPAIKTALHRAFVKAPKRMGPGGPAIAVGALLAIGAASPAWAQKCSDSGRLAYIGRFANDSASIWLSRNLLSEARNFRLEAAQQGGSGGGFFQEFGISSRGLHLSLSPVVSNGGGGVHQLYVLPENCFVDSQNQQGGIVLGGLGAGRPTFLPGLVPGGSPGGGAVTLPGSAPESPGGGGAVTLPGSSPGSPGGGGAVTLPGSAPGAGSGSGSGSGGGSAGGSAGGTDGGAVEGTTDGGRRGPTLNDVLAFDRAQAAAAAFERARGISDRLVAETFRPLRPDEGVPDAQDRSSRAHGWNAWFDSRGVSADDGRYGRDFYGRLADVYAGLDYRISGDALIGIAMGGEFWDASDFGGTLRSSVDTFVIGPYGAWRLTDWLMVDSWFGYARGSQSITLAFLEGDRTIDTVFVSLNMTAQAWVDGFRIRPKVSAYAANANAGGFSFVAPPSVIGTSFAIPVSSSSDGIALAEASVEIAYPMRVNDSVVVTPTLRPGATVATNRANGGRVVTGELDVTTPAQVYGSIRVGLQVNVGNRTAVDLSAGYMSIGQPGLDLWSGRIAVNVAF